MHIALLTGASPKTSKGGPHVRLPHGIWKFDVQGVVDSKLVLVCDAARLVIEHGASFIVSGIVHIEFENRGTEDYLTIAAVR